MTYRLDDIMARDEANYPEALAAMEAVMLRPAFAYKDLVAAGDAAVLARGRSCYRWADRLLQKKKRAGLIQLRGHATWVPTP